MKKISPWIYAARPKTLTASIVPIVCAISNSTNRYSNKKKYFIFTFIAAIIIQVITNYINDLYDFLKGSDKNRLGPDRMLQSGLISIENMKLGISILFVLVCYYWSAFSDTWWMANINNWIIIFFICLYVHCWTCPIGL